MDFPVPTRSIVTLGRDHPVRAPNVSISTLAAKLRQVDVLISQAQNMVDAIRQIGVSEVTYYRVTTTTLQGVQGSRAPLDRCEGDRLQRRGRGPPRIDERRGH